MKCYIDLDGVMVDLERGLYETLNFTFPTEYNSTSRKIIHDMWYTIQRDHPHFWENLHPMQGYKELYSVIRMIDPQPFILSATPEPYTGTEERDCRWQKTNWVYNHLGQTQAIRTIITKSKLKQNYVQKNQPCMLIDDHPGNIQRWNDAGGIGILHKSNEETIEILKGYIK